MLGDGGRITGGLSPASCRSRARVRRGGSCWNGLSEAKTGVAGTLTSQPVLGIDNPLAGHRTSTSYQSVIDVPTGSQCLVEDGRDAPGPVVQIDQAGSALL